MLRTKRTILLCASLILPAVAFLSWWAWQGMEDTLHNERHRISHLEEGSVGRVVDGLGFELFDLRFTWSGALGRLAQEGTTDWLPAVDRVRTAYRAQAHYPGLIDEIDFVSGPKEGPLHWWRWSPDGWDPADEPPGLVPDRRFFDTLADPEVNLEKPWFTFYLPSEGHLHRAVVVRYSVQVVLKTIVPDLVKTAFAGVGTPGFEVAVTRNVLGTASAGVQADLTVPLVRPVKFTDWLRNYLDRTSPPPPDPSVHGFAGDLWTLSVTFPPQGLSAYVRGIETTNLVWGILLFLSLGTGLLVLLVSLLRAIEASRREQALAAMVSHELKTPVAVTRSLAENLASGLVTEPDRVREYGSRLLEQANLLGAMVGQILDRGRRETFDLADLAREQAAGLPVSVPPNGSWSVERHRATAAAALGNLISNARKYGCSAEGSPGISLALLRERRWGRRWVGVSVVDHGRKLDRKRFRNLFRNQPHPDGPGNLPGGVGLSLVRASFRHLGGRVVARQLPTSGLVLVLWLRESPNR
jgi:signal transduction histidine kinase